MKVTQFESAISEIVVTPTEDFKHPFLTTIRFIFADDRGNANNQGIEAEDFESVAQTSVHMPIKMRYKNNGLGNHDFSVPIGHIVDMHIHAASAEGEASALVGEAVLYAEEYPDEVEFLKKKFENDEAPGISWEMSYKESVKKNGIDWLKGAVTRAATFVKSPAYGNRTALLAIAQSHAEEEGFMTELQKFIDTWAQSQITDKGGMNVDEKELQAKIDELTKAAAELEPRIATLEAELETAKAANLTLTEEKTALTEEVNGFKRSAVVADRTAKVVEAGLTVADDQLEAKQEVWVSLSEDQFSAYVADIAAVKTATPIKDASASTKKDDLPKFTVSGMETSTIDDLKAAGRRASRGQLADL